MKKFLSFYLSIIMLISLIVPSLANQNNALYKANEKLSYNEKNIATTLISYEGKDYIPIRVVANLLGLSVEWDGDTHTVYMDETTTAEPLIINNNDINKFITVKDQQRIHLVFKNMEISKIISDTGININGTETMIPIDTILYNNTTYVDISAFCSFFLRDYKNNVITDKIDEITLANEAINIYKNRNKYSGYVSLNSKIPTDIKPVEHYLSAYMKSKGHDDFKLTVFIRKTDDIIYERYKFFIDNTIPQTLNFNIRDIVDELNLENMKNDADKVNKINEYICHKYTYDKAYKNSKTNKTSESISEILASNSVVWHGYAVLFKELCNYVGIYCEYIAGDVMKNTPNTVYHAWNKVILNNKEYYFDSCWNDSKTASKNIQMFSWLSYEEMEKAHFNK